MRRPSRLANWASTARLNAVHPHRLVLVVAHNTLIRLALCSLFSIPLARYRTVFPTVRNGALTEIGLEEKNAALLQYNSPLARSVRSRKRLARRTRSSRLFKG